MHLRREQWRCNLPVSVIASLEPTAAAAARSGGESITFQGSAAPALPAGGASRNPRLLMVMYTCRLFKLRTCLLDLARQGRKAHYVIWFVGVDQIWDSVHTHATCRRVHGTRVCQAPSAVPSGQCFCPLDMVPRSSPCATHIIQHPVLVTPQLVITVLIQFAGRQIE